MSEGKEEILDETDSMKNSTLHIETGECFCPECKKGRKHYVQILDVDRYINTLSDWD